ncbi:retropepsin-like aspartic protease family protein [Candidatus Entotheonella palauensis]|uniref:Peptidase A2 domain-containing protein n=1 Tax=Candidatus Entotheonella gemina TaxID=1429439 RepID=W4M7C3_9BACT|nr:retropepsin-like aspartic protease [Candidatus Entotheonella palauensis]ETX06254.1 MAG: hypothetical protein ETSY2_18215 [Candidatus Entotheonella gemina]
MPSHSASRIQGRIDYGGLLLVPVEIDGMDFEFLVDTGAAYTAMSERLASLLNVLTPDPHRLTIAPVHGRTISVPQVRLPTLRLGGIELTQVEAVVVSFPSILRLHGIIGMNILSRFRMTLESDTRTLVLRTV